MKITVYQCSRCKDWIFSRAPHDLRWCSCRALGIDGGFDLLRVLSKERKFPKLKCIHLNVTVDDLYDDWNNSTNKFGLIKSGAKNGKKKVSSNKRPARGRLNRVNATGLAV